MAKKWPPKKTKTKKAKSTPIMDAISSSISHVSVVQGYLSVSTTDASNAYTSYISATEGGQINWNSGDLVYSIKGPGPNAYNAHGEQYVVTEPEIVAMVQIFEDHVEVVRDNASYAEYPYFRFRIDEAVVSVASTKPHGIQWTAAEPEKRKRYLVYLYLNNVVRVFDTPVVYGNELCKCGHMKSMHKKENGCTRCAVCYGFVNIPPTGLVGTGTTLP